jgi:hypothetical protein
VWLTTPKFVRFASGADGPLAWLLIWALDVDAGTVADNAI